MSLGAFGSTKELAVLLDTLWTPYRRQSAVDSVIIERRSSYY
jgi:hypothetical protein